MKAYSIWSISSQKLLETQARNMFTKASKPEIVITEICQCVAEMYLPITLTHWNCRYVYETWKQNCLNNTESIQKSHNGILQIWAIILWHKSLSYRTWYYWTSSQNLWQSLRVLCALSVLSICLDPVHWNDTQVMRSRVFRKYFSRNILGYQITCFLYEGWNSLIYPYL